MSQMPAQRIQNSLELMNTYETKFIIDEAGKVFIQIYNAPGTRIFFGSLEEVQYFINALESCVPKAEALEIAARGN